MLYYIFTSSNARLARLAYAEAEPFASQQQAAAWVNEHQPFYSQRLEVVTA